MYDGIAAQYYLRARWYSPVTGRFNRMDPFAGNNRDPQSLHKYLYVHCNPINSIDPTGEITIPSLVSAIWTRAVAFNSYVGGIVTAAKPIIKTVLGAWIIHEIVRGIYSESEISAFSLGCSGNIPFLFHTGFTGGMELAIGRNTGNIALFGTPGISTNYGFGVSLINVGMAFNAPSSFQYRGSSRAITISLSVIPPSLRKVIRDKFQSFLPSFHAAFLKRKNEIAQAIPTSLVRRFSRALTWCLSHVFSVDASVTLWEASPDSFGFSFAPGFSSFNEISFDGSDKYTTGSFLSYIQVSPTDENGYPIDVEF